MNRIYTDNIDMAAILDAVQPEFSAGYTRLAASFADTFAKTATPAGILRWEHVLGISADPATEPLEFRRGRILNRLASNAPFTERALHGIMDNIMGVDGWSYALDYRNYRLDITSLLPGRNWLREMEDTLGKIIPANLEFQLHIYYASWESVHEDFSSWGEIYDSGRTWLDIMEGI